MTGSVIEQPRLEGVPTPEHAGGSADVSVSLVAGSVFAERAIALVSSTEGQPSTVALVEERIMVASEVIVFTDKDVAGETDEQRAMRLSAPDHRMTVEERERAERIVADHNRARAQERAGYLAVAA